MCPVISLHLSYPTNSASRRAGLRPETPAFRALLDAALVSSSISIYGFYTHAGNSYASTSFDDASNFLLSEVNAVNTAAGLALQIIAATPGLSQPREPYVLSVGATPTAHAATPELRASLEPSLHGVLELHAGELFLPFTPSYIYLKKSQATTLFSISNN